MKRFSAVYLVLAAAVIAGLLYWGRSVERPVPILRVQLQWFDQAQFAGLYAALRNGFYEKEGLKVELIGGGYNVPPIERVKFGNADIGLATGDQILLAKANGQSLKAFGTVFNVSMACFISKRATSVRTAQDLRGKKVGVYPGFDTENVLLALLNKWQIPKDSLNIANAGQIEAFINGELDAFPSYLFNEPIMMKERGIDVDILWPEQQGVFFYSDTFFTTKEYWEKNRDLLRRFIRASAKGWNAVRQQPDEAIDWMYEVRRNISDSSRPHQLNMVKEAAKHLGAGNQKQLFFMERARWEEMEKHLNAIGKLKTIGHVDDLVDFDLVPESAK